MTKATEFGFALAGYFALNICYSIVFGTGFSIEGALNSLFASIFLPIWALFSMFRNLQAFLAVVILAAFCGFVLRKLDPKHWRYILLLGLLGLEIVGAYSTTALAI